MAIAFRRSLEPFCLIQTVLSFIAFLLERLTVRARPTVHAEFHAVSLPNARESQQNRQRDPTG
jgi:hypothetical protein